MGNKWVQNHLLTIAYYLLNHILPYIYHYLQYIYIYIGVLFCFIMVFFVLINVHPLKALLRTARVSDLGHPASGGRKRPRPDEATGPRKLVNGKQYNGSYNKWDSKNWLVVSNIFYDFPYIGNVIIPTDEVIFFRGVGKSTSQKMFHPIDTSFWLVLSMGCNPQWCGGLSHSIPCPVHTISMNWADSDLHGQTQCGKFLGVS